MQTVCLSMGGGLRRSIVSLGNMGTFFLFSFLLFFIYGKTFIFFVVACFGFGQ